MLYDNQVHITPYELKVLPKNQEVMGGLTDVAHLLEGRLGIGNWRLSSKTSKVYLSPKAKEILNIPTGTALIQVNEFLSCFVSADKSRLTEAFQKTLFDQTGFSAVLRRSIDNHVKVLEVYCDPILDENNKIDGIVGSIQDITKRAKSSMVASGRSAMMRVIMRNIPSAIAVLNRNMVYLAASNHWAAGHGVATTEELVGKQHYKLFPHTVTYQEEHQRVLAGETVRAKRAVIKDRNGQPIEQTCVMSPWRTSDGTVGGMIIMLGTVDLENTIRFADEQLAEAGVETGLLESLQAV